VGLAAPLRPDRFRVVVTISVPMMEQPPVPPSKIFPQTEDALFYTLYFQEKLADEEFNRDVSLTLRELIFAAIGEAGRRKPGDGTSNPFGMVAKGTGLLASLPTPARPPEWLHNRECDQLARAFEISIAVC
jgi:hypothetical protein